MNRIWRPVFPILTILWGLWCFSRWNNEGNKGFYHWSDQSFRKEEYRTLLLATKSQRRLITFNPIVDKGNSSWVRNKTIHGAILQTCRFEKTFFFSHLRHSHSFKHCETASESNSKQLLSPLPVPFAFWPTIIGRSCPFPVYHGQGTLHATSLTAPSFRFIERGYGLSHMQIWLEFIFFDHDTLNARLRKPPEYLTSTTWSSVSGTFQSFANGTLRKNDVVFLEEDLIIVIEEDSIPQMNISQTNLLQLEKELTSMNISEILLLKPCIHANLTEHQRRLQGIPTHPRVSDHLHAHHSHLSHHGGSSSSSCFQSYVMSRAIARLFVKDYDVCAIKASFDQQLLSLIQHYNLSLLHSQSQIFTS